MARAILTVSLIVLLNVLVGCQATDGGKSAAIPTRTGSPFEPAQQVDIATASEVDIVERMVVNRRAYRQGLGLLVEHYADVGNNMKLQWAKKELASLDTIPQYNYIVEASLAGPDLKASTSIPEADYLYMDAMRLENKARELIVIVDENLLRRALDKYNQLIRKYPTSDKIDDAAYKAGGIYKHFQDYSIAALYYQRAHQWNPDTIYPAAFRAAYILDRRLHRRAEALQLYQQAIKNKELLMAYKTFAEKRINELSKGGE